MLPLISDRMARNGLSVRPVRTSRPTRAVDLQSNDQSRPFATPSGRPLRNTLRKTPPKHPSGRTLRNTLRKNPSQPPFEDNLSETAFEDPFGTNPPGRPLRKHLRDAPPRKTLSEPFGEWHVFPKHPIVKNPSERAACPETLSEPSRSPAECPFEAFAGTPFGTLRSMTPVPKASPEASFGTSPFETPSGPTFGARHVPPSAEAESQPRKPPSAPQASRKPPSAP